VGGVERHGDLVQDLDGAPRRQLPGRLQLGEGRAAHELHRHVLTVQAGPGCIQADDVAMLRPPQAPEALGDTGVGLEELERDAPVEVDLRRLVDGSA